MSKFSRLKLFVPDWDDIVDPNFDFENERHSTEYKRDRYKYGARIWDIFENPPLDGVLISLSTIESKLDKIRQMGGIKKFLHLEGKGLEVLADCGAWQYRYSEKPKYSPEEALKYYRELSVDYGVSVDHIAFFGDPQERIKLTLQNAEKSFEIWRKGYERGDYSFKLMASIQGIEVRDYIENMRKLYRKGYRYFAVGGLAKRDTNFIITLIEDLKEVLKRELIDVERIHFLGVARPKLALYLKELVDHVSDISFDNATYLRSAWMRHLDNYITLDGKAYTAIRVRIGSAGERELLNLLRSYDRGKISLNELVPKLRDYVVRIGDIPYLPYYVRTLKDRPWNSCNCPICRKLGIDVIIFRGNNRNRRRGFHNLYVFYTLFKSGRFYMNFSFRTSPPANDLVATYASSNSQANSNVLVNELLAKLKERGLDRGTLRKVLVITYCTASKDVDIDKVRRALLNAGMPIPGFDLNREGEYRGVLRGFMKPAIQMYKGTFNLVKRLVNFLRSKGVEVDFYILSARYGLIRDDEVIVPYDATLKGMKKEHIRAWAAERKVPEKTRELLNNNYDVIVVVLPNEYAYALGSTLRMLMNRCNAILVIPSSLSTKARSMKALVLAGGSLTRRVKSLNILFAAIRSLYASENLLKYLKGKEHQ